MTHTRRRSISSISLSVRPMKGARLSFVKYWGPTPRTFAAIRRLLNQIHFSTSCTVSTFATIGSVLSIWRAS